MTKTAIKTLAQFCEESHLSTDLIKAVVRQSGGWESFKESAPDICRGGIDGGFHGFIYTADTNSFARRNRALIADLAREQAADFGTPVVEMIQNFGCFRHSNPKPTDEEIGQCLWGGVMPDKDEAGIYNAMAWYAGEEVARSYVDLTERE